MSTLHNRSPNLNVATAVLVVAAAACHPTSTTVSTASPQASAATNPSDREAPSELVETVGKPEAVTPSTAATSCESWRLRDCFAGASDVIDGLAWCAGDPCVAAAKEVIACQDKRAPRSVSGEVDMDAYQAVWDERCRDLCHVQISDEVVDDGGNGEPACDPAFFEHLSSSILWSNATSPPRRDKSNIGATLGIPGAKSKREPDDFRPRYAESVVRHVVERRLRECRGDRDSTAQTQVTVVLKASEGGTASLVQASSADSAMKRCAESRLEEPVRVPPSVATQWPAPTITIVRRWSGLSG